VLVHDDELPAVAPTLDEELPAVAPTLGEELILSFVTWYLGCSGVMFSVCRGSPFGIESCLPCLVTS